MAKTKTLGDQRLLLILLKALADDSRLTLLGLLSEGERNVGELADLTRLSEPTVSHHLAKLRAVGLANLRAEGNLRLYRVNTSRLNTFKQLVAQIEKLPDEEASESDDSWIDELDIQDWEREVLRSYTANGRITQIPTKQKRLLVILRWLATKFQPEVKYTEADVNAILKEYHSDFVSLRRDLVDFGFLRRERNGAAYWRAPH